jgi:DNA polymerase III delta prime subunit
MLSEFISELKSLDSDSKVIKYIPNFDEFIESLNKLDSMIGMKEVKDNMVSQVKYYLINKYRNITSNDKQEFFHTVLLGPPGSGKTTVAEVLADIWINLGVLNSKESSKDNGDDEKILKSETYKKLQKKNEDLLKKFSIQANEIKTNQLKISNIKNDLFYEKKKISELLSFLQNHNEKLDEEVYENLKHKVETFDYIIDASLKNNCKTESNFTFEEINNENVKESSKEVNNFITKEPKNSLIAELLRMSKEDLIFPNKDNSEAMFAKRFEKPESLIDENLKVLKFRRDDLVGKFVGHTAVKTREALMKGINKVIFLDEAYELYNTSTSEGCDAFGMECLNTILHFMNEYSDKCIIIFAGYEDLLKKTIFRVQPGLERRIGWTFNISPYNHNELADIYEKQLKEKSWNLDKKDKKKIAELFKKNDKLFKNGGGDTLRLAMYTKTVYSDVSFEKIFKGEEITSDITYEIVDKALEVLRFNIENQGEKATELSYYT